MRRAESRGGGGHTVLECEVAVTLKTAAGIKVTGRSGVGEQLVKSENQMGVFLRHPPTSLSGSTTADDKPFSAKRRSFAATRFDHTFLGAPAKVLLQSPAPPLLLVFCFVFFSFFGPGRTWQERP